MTEVDWMPNLIALSPHSRAHNGWDANGGNFIMSVQGQSKRQSLLRPDSDAIFLILVGLRGEGSHVIQQRRASTRKMSTLCPDHVGRPDNYQ